MQGLTVLPLSFTESSVGDRGGLEVEGMVFTIIAVTAVVEEEMSYHMFSFKKKKRKSVLKLEGTRKPTAQSRAASETVPRPTSPSPNPQNSDSVQRAFPLQV